jgi:predicted Rossmann-fold nucleotide-binding protein
VTLVQTRKIENFPVVLMGESYWRPLLDFLQTTMVANKTISPEDINLLTVTDSPDVAIKAIRDALATKAYFQNRPKRNKLLAE